MKKKYERPVVYSEDITLAFAQECCIETTNYLTTGARPWCLGCGEIPGDKYSAS